MKNKCILFFVLIICIFPMFVKASDITSSSTILINKARNNKIVDNKENTYVKINLTDAISIENAKEITGLYIVYERESKEGTITLNNNSMTIGNKGFLHEYIDLSKEHTNILSISYKDVVSIADVYVLDEGELPEFVEVWKEPCKNADLMLISTHSDDEQLFFLGLLPTYVARGADVQVVYFANHYNDTKRLHEQLHGLYAVGIRNYPIIGDLPDAWSTNLAGAIANAERKSIKEEDLIKFDVEMFRRFKPQVVVGHDEKGEYQHGQHILNTYILKKAIEKSNDKNYDQESYEEYDLWDVPKTYLHLYEENKIVMDYDVPLDYFDGKTAYEVSKIGYSKHLSQQWTWFTKWINGKNNSYKLSTDIKTYSPNDFGLYRSLVGEDVNKNDMFENLEFRKDQKEVIDMDNKIITSNKRKPTTLSEYRPYIIAALITNALLLIYYFKKR